MTLTSISNRYIKAIQMKTRDQFVAEQMFMTILLDKHSTEKERSDASSQLFDIAIRNENPSYAMYIWEIMMGQQNILLSDMELYPHLTQLTRVIGKVHAMKLYSIKDLSSLLAFHENSYKDRRILLFLYLVKPFVQKALQDPIQLLIDKSSHLETTFSHSSPIMVQS